MGVREDFFAGMVDGMGVELAKANAKGYAANNDRLGEFFSDPNVAMGFVQGAIRRALETHGVIPRYKKGSEQMVGGQAVGGEVVEYFINGVAVSEYNSRTGTMIHRADCTKDQTRLINAHASVYGTSV